MKFPSSGAKKKRKIHHVEQKLKVYPHFKRSPDLDLDSKSCSSYPFCICAFVCFCICVLVYLCICVDRLAGNGRVVQPISVPAYTSLKRELRCSPVALAMHSINK